VLVIALVKKNYENVTRAFAACFHAGAGGHVAALVLSAHRFHDQRTYRLVGYISARRRASDSHLASRKHQPALRGLQPPAASAQLPDERRRSEFSDLGQR